MIKKVLIIILTINLITLIQSCCTEEYQYKWTDFSIGILDNSGEYPVLTDNKEVNKNALGLRITLQDTVMYLAQNFTLVNECYATSCAEEYTRINNLSSIKIITLLDYSSKYPKDSDITQLFMARESGNTKSTYISIDQIISNVNGSSHTYNGYSDFDLYLIDTTALIEEQRFKVQLTMSDGNIFTQESDTLKFY